MKSLTGRVIFFKARRVFELVTFGSVIIIVIIFYLRWTSPLKDVAQLDEGVRNNPYLPHDKQMPMEKSNYGQPNLAKYVHLDLKGAPPKADQFYQQFFNVLQSLQMGVKGVLMEYEDTLPLQGNLANVGHREGYSKQDIELIRDAAKKHQLEIIPLVQTFGHLEWILKLEKFKSYRDNPNLPTVISPCFNATYVLLEDLLQQTLNMHPNSHKIHIGCDEVIITNSHDQCGVNVMSISEGYISHVRRVVDIVQKIRPGIRILIWDDILRDGKIIGNEKLLNQLKGLVEPVSWRYLPTFDHSYKYSNAWSTYPKFFPNTWAASAFKGGQHRFSVTTNTTHHVLNNRQWLHFMQSSTFEKKPFSAIILTGWSRFDHFMPLCDLLPTAYPSLLYSLHVLNTDQLFDDDSNFDCNSLMKSIGKDKKLCELLPGVSIWLRISSISKLLLQIQDRLKVMNTIAPDYNRKHSFVRRAELNWRLDELKNSEKTLSAQKLTMNRHLLHLYSQSDINEWFDLYVAPIQQQINKTVAELSLAFNQTSWAQRPLT